ncbi:glucokinase [Roseibium aquae]|uniref:Glucokinase n=1 Tax=Roseibium aquae TaxID=1323746 RepID=A0A916TMF9_9HYPH|nr:glucokinase [Roseibium aquae]GGB57649.1 glucokinase [Roseibium aquae]
MNITNHQTGDFTFPVLVADVGGTNARFAIVQDSNDTALAPVITATGDHADICAAIRATVLASGAPQPRSAILAVAGPVTGDRIPLTNAAWVIEPNVLIKQLGLDHVVVLNDFEAQALALPSLKGGAVEQIGGGVMRKNATKFVLGPGTGLGAAALVYAAGKWIPLPGEGGHVEIGAVSDEDQTIWPHIERVGGRIGAEQILSGTGLPRLARAVAASMGLQPHHATAADVTWAASTKDPVATKTLEVFARGLGRVAGDFAMTVLARGGVYLTGGVTPRIDRFLINGGFRASFEAKAPHEALLKSIPTFLVRHPNPALEGLAAYARDPDLFAVDLSGRAWQAKFDMMSLPSG